MQRGRELLVGREGEARGERRRCRRIDDEHAVRAVRERAIGLVQDLVDLGRFARAYQADVVGDPDIRVLDVADIPGERSVLDAVAVALVPGVGRGDQLDHLHGPSIVAFRSGWAKIPNRRSSSPVIRHLAKRWSLVRTCPGPCSSSATWPGWSGGAGSAGDGLGRRTKAELDLPTRVVNRMVSTVAKRRLQSFKLSGKPS